MATKEAHNRASVEYNKRQDNIMIRPSKEMGAIIRQSAAAENMSVQRYVLQTLYARTGATGGGVVKNPETGSLSLERRSCLISPDRGKILRDILRDIVLNTALGERNALSDLLVQIINESIEQNADSVYQTVTDSLL
jgi:hypothetical protein